MTNFILSCVLLQVVVRNVLSKATAICSQWVRRCLCACYAAISKGAALLRQRHPSSCSFPVSLLLLLPSSTLTKPHTNPDETASLFVNSAMCQINVAGLRCNAGGEAHKRGGARRRARNRAQHWQ